MVPKTKLPLGSSCWISFATGLGTCGTPELVDPILRDVTPVYEYELNTWGPPDADRIMEGAGGWHNPKHEEAIG